MTQKKKSLFLFSFALALILSAQCFVFAAPWPKDSDFLVGAAGHPSFGDTTFWSGYGGGDADIERQVHLLAEMGAKIYRFDVHASTRADTANFADKVITLCERYGIAVLMIVHIDAGAEAVAKRFKGKVKYYQVNNEMNFQAHKAELNGDGTKLSHFWMSTDIDRPKKEDGTYDDNKCLDILIDKAIDTIKVIRAEDPGAKILINGGWTHYGFLDYAFAEFAKAGVDIDLIGWDWYSNMENNRNGAHFSVSDGLNSVAKYMYDTYGKDIIICEYNMWIANFDRTSMPATANYVPFLPGDGNGKIDPFEEDNMDTLIGPYLVNNIQYLYNNRAENHIKGIMIYELIEQRGLLYKTEPAPSDPFEAKFGITYSKVLTPYGRNYQILGPKKAYYDVQELLGGGFVPIERLNPSAVTPKYTITASVIDVNQDGVIMPSRAGGTVDGSGIYSENSVVTLKAAAKPGYEFLGWYRGGIRISKEPEYQFTAYEDANNGDRDSSDGKFAYEARVFISAANVEKAFEYVIYYPNPIQPSKGLNYAKMTFSNMPAGTRIKIYTMLGQVVRELKADASGTAVWDGRNNAGEKAASGVYIVYMEDGNGNKKRIKVAVER